MAITKETQTNFYHSKLSRLLILSKINRRPKLYTAMSTIFFYYFCKS